MVKSQEEFSSETEYNAGAQTDQSGRVRNLRHNRAGTGRPIELCRTREAILVVDRYVVNVFPYIQSNCDGFRADMGLMLHNKYFVFKYSDI